MEKINDEEQKSILASIYSKRAINYFREGFFDKAILEFTKSLEINPLDIDNIYHRAHAYYEEGGLIMALQEISRVLKADPHYAMAYYTRGLILEKKKDFTGASNAYKECIAAAPGKQEVTEPAKKRLDAISNP